MVHTCKQPSKYGDTESDNKEGKLVACLSPCMAVLPWLDSHRHLLWSELNYVARGTCWEDHKETVGRSGTKEGVREEGGKEGGREGGRGVKFSLKC